MKLAVDAEGEKAIKTLADCTLKHAGLEGLPFTLSVIESMTRLSEKDGKSERQEDANDKGSNNN